MSANFSCPSQHSPSTLPTRSLPFPSPATPSLPSKSILALLPRKILVPPPPQYPNTPYPIPLSLPCYLASLGLWIIAWLSFISNIHLQLRTCHVCLSYLTHDNAFLVLSNCQQQIITIFVLIYCCYHYYYHYYLRQDLIKQLCLAWNYLYKSGWPPTHKDLPASPS